MKKYQIAALANGKFRLEIETYRHRLGHYFVALGVPLFDTLVEARNYKLYLENHDAGMKVVGVVG